EVATAAALPVLGAGAVEGRGTAPAELHDVVVLAGERLTETVGVLDDRLDPDLGQGGLLQLERGGQRRALTSAQPERTNRLALVGQGARATVVPLEAGVGQDLPGPLDVTAAVASAGDVVLVVRAVRAVDVVGTHGGVREQVPEHPVDDVLRVDRGE